MYYLNKKHKILNLDNTEDGNLIQTNDKEKNIFNYSNWAFRKQNYLLKNREL